MKTGWPGANARRIVKEMLADPGSPHWEACLKLVKRLVKASARGMSPDLQDEIAQRTIIKVWLYLPGFRFQCSLDTWLGFIVRSRINDEYRDRIRRREKVFGVLEGKNEDGENVPFDIAGPDTLEDKVIEDEKESEVLISIQDYVMQAKDPERTLNIVKRVIEDDASFRQVAKELNENAPNIGYMFRRLRRHLQNWLDQRDSKGE